MGLDRELEAMLLEDILVYLLFGNFETDYGRFW